MGNLVITVSFEYSMSRTGRGKLGLPEKVCSDAGIRTMLPNPARTVWQCGVEHRRPEKHRPSQRFQSWWDRTVSNPGSCDRSGSVWSIMARFPSAEIETKAPSMGGKIPAAVKYEKLIM
ncbi:hypothetical protein [Ruegeria arenilitoris]|uniref:hypothetical protein n=1 Tax=Ruegeria arenilitoris TaxID=1173585 RepID=UPI00147A770F|nr:hypothetical protein [Ruegeria arenilitoris]